MAQIKRISSLFVETVIFEMVVSPVRAACVISEKTPFFQKWVIQLQVLEQKPLEWYIFLWHSIHLVLIGFPIFLWFDIYNFETLVFLHGSDVIFEKTRFFFKNETDAASSIGTRITRRINFLVQFHSSRANCCPNFF